MQNGLTKQPVERKACSRLLFFVLTIGTFLSVFYANGQARISGSVTNAEGHPLPNASVQLSYGESGRILRFALTDKMGFYQLTPLLPMTVTVLQVSHDEYAMERLYLTTFPKKDTVINFVLVSKVGVLDSVIVRSEKKGMDTTAFAADSLYRRYHQNIEDLLRNIPNLNIVNGGLSYKGKAISKILFEGDDVSQANYRYLIKSLSTHSLDSIQLIDNYIDKTALGNAFKNHGDELVLNLKFKGKKQLRNYGRVGVGSGVGMTVYQAAIDDIALSKRSKLISIGNYNSKGLVTEYLFEQNGYSLSSNTLRNDFLISQELIPYALNIAPHTVLPEYIGVERIYRNNSVFLTSDLFTRISTRTFLKVNVHGMYDRLPQQLNKRESFVDSSYLNTNEAIKASKKQFNGNAEVTLNHALSSESQYKGTIKYSNKNIVSSGSNLFNQFTDTTDFEGSVHTVIFTNQFTKLLNKTTTLFATLYVADEISNERLIKINSLYKSLFQQEDIGSVLQHLSRERKSIEVSAGIERKLNRNFLLNIKAGYNYQASSFESDLSKGDPSGWKAAAADSFSNRVFDNRSNIYLYTSGSKSGYLGRGAYGITLRNVIRLMSVDNKNHVTQRLTGFKSQVLWSPYLTLDYTIRKGLFISSSFYLSNNIVENASMYSGNILYDQNSFRRGFEDVQLIQNIPSATFQISNTIEKLGRASVSYTYQRIPVQYGSDFSNYGYFNFIKQVYFPIPSASNTFHSSLLFHFLKTNVSFNAYYSFSKYTFLLNDKRIASKSMFANHFITLHNSSLKWLTNQLEIRRTGFEYKQETAALPLFKNKSSNVVVTYEGNGMFLESYNLKFIQKWIRVKGAMSRPENYFFSDLNIGKTFGNGRLSVVAECRNLLNRRTYSVVVQTQISQVYTNTSILPRMFIVGAAYKF